MFENCEHCRMCKKIIRIVIALGLLCMIWVLATGCKNNEDYVPLSELQQNTQHSTTDSSFVEKNEVITSADVGYEQDTSSMNNDLNKKTYDIETPFGSFVLSGSWTGDMIIDLTWGNAYIIRGLCQTGNQSKIHLFDVSFGNGDGELLGYVSKEDGTVVPVYIKLGAVDPDESWTDIERQEFYAMQAEVNSILSQLDFVESETTEQTENMPAVEVQTSYLSLFIPGRFADILHTEVYEGDIVTVSFYGTPDGVGKILLYDFVINGDSELPLGFYTLADGSRVSVDICNFQDYPMDGWSEEAQRQFHMMMECINDIILALEESGNFSY